MKDDTRKRRVSHSPVIEHNQDDDRKPPAVVITRRLSQNQQHPDDHNSVESMSTAALATPFTSFKSSGSRQESITPYHAYSEVVLWSGSALLSTLAFLYAIVPTAALTTLSALVFSVYMLLTSGLNHALRHEYERLLQSDRGIGDYIPASWYRVLTEKSWHEQLNPSGQGSLVSEHRHLLLYFLPMPREQRMHYLEQMAPRHREMLQRPGLGHALLPPQAMRVLMGQGRYPQEEEGGGVDRQLFSEPSAGSQQQQQPLARSRAEYQREKKVLKKAVVKVVQRSTYNRILVPASSFARDMATRLLQPVAGGLLGVSLTSGGLALYASQFWANVGRRNRSPQQWQPSLSDGVWITSAVSGVAAAVAYTMHWYFRRYSKAIEKEEEA